MDGSNEMPGVHPETEPAAAADRKIALTEEFATIGVRDVATGRVRIRTLSELVERVETRELQGIEAEVLRRPINRMLDPGEPVPGVREEDGVLIVPIFEEVAVTEVRLMLKEELHLTQHTTTETVEIPLSLRKQTAVVERTGPDGAPAGHREENQDDQD